tara:strand:- start:1771 stop:1980 length:210 start_codon:yes stop_codon:yes gene_type:complete
MGLSDKLKKQGENPKVENPKQPQGNSKELSKQELEFLIRMIGDSNFKGKDLMFIYDLVKKLQDMYVETK